MPSLSGSALLPDRVPFEGRVYSATLIGSEYVITSTNLDGSGQVDYHTGGIVVTRPTLAANDDRTLLVVYGANASGQLYMIGKKAGQNWTGWVYLGDGVIDQPQAYGGRVGVGVTVTRTDYQRWTKTTTDGLGQDNWSLNNGMLIPLGTNSLLPNYAPTQDTDLSYLHPRVQRVRMYMDGTNLCCSEMPRFTWNDLNRLHDNGVRIMIINLSEAITDTGRFERQIGVGPQAINIGGGTILGWARAHSDTMVILEVGNESDQVYATYGTDYYNPWNTRWRALDIADDWNNTQQHSDGQTYSLKLTNKNVEIMISLPTINGYAYQHDEDYFLAFTGDTGDGRGRVGDKYRHVGVHVYSNGCLLRTDNIYDHSVMRILDLAKQATNGGVYITESAINSHNMDPDNYAYIRNVLVPRYNQPDPLNGYANARWAELGRRYVNALTAFDNIDGRVKGVTFFQDFHGGTYGPGSTEPYNIDDGNTTGQHAHWAMGNRIGSIDCVAPANVNSR
ncbi:MAG TPA: hypothetical protein VFU78_01160 [Thermomicrobiales bacterium]|nr:hypothetical protein [Thermomicrobiales bacterium]